MRDFSTRERQEARDSHYILVATHQRKKEHIRRKLCEKVHHSYPLPELILPRKDGDVQMVELHRGKKENLACFSKYLGSKQKYKLTVSPCQKRAIWGLSEYTCGKKEEM